MSVKNHQVHRFILNNKPVDVVVKYYRQSKRLSLKTDYIHQRGILTAPYNVSENFILKWLESQVPWLTSKLATYPSIQDITNLTTINLLGKIYSIKVESSSLLPKVELTNNSFIIYGNFIKYRQLLTKKLYASFKSMLKEYIVSKVRNITCLLKISYNKITIRNNISSRWGSCSSLGNLNFNWRLIFAPIVVLDYIIVHEVAHLIQFNHSATFWKLVNDLHPTYKQEVLWLRKNGKSLYTISI